MSVRNSPKKRARSIMARSVDRHIYGETTLEEARELVGRGRGCCAPAAGSEERKLTPSASQSGCRRHHHVVHVHIVDSRQSQVKGSKKTPCVFKMVRPASSS